MKNNNSYKLEAITPSTLIVGIDIAKKIQWARFTDYRGLELGKAIKFQNDKIGFESILASIQGVCKLKGLDKVVIGMEPTGHYWKPLANYLILNGITVVMVNPYHTKRAKELDDNSPTKSDKKDAITIARLVRDGRYYEVYMPQDTFAELRVLSNSRISLMKRHNALKNTITAVMDEYFPEIVKVFKHPLKGKASIQIMKSCPFPSLILKLGVDGVLAEIKKAVKKTVGIKKAQQLVETAKESIGVNYGLVSAKLKVGLMIEELELITRQLEQIEDSMEQALADTGLKDILLSIPGIGVVTAASFLGEIGDPLRFEHPAQINRMAGYNLVEDSSGKNVSGTVISKRGRKNLRNVLYQMAMIMVAVNAEMKELYQYLKTRPNNPLKKKQALVVISKKIVTIIYNLVKKQTQYKAKLVFGEFRKNQMKQVA
ncbi:MAG TPA: IS110 family transposase [Thermoanaerobacterales bacterium]|jgi:transposase|nr:IS110 family transposase [Thermoanaerobacterales bacterium]